MTPTVLIVGYGVVGHNLAREIAALHPDIYDKFHPEHNTKRDICYDFAFICVDTPLDHLGYCDAYALTNAILETKAHYYIIKSTLTPNALDKMCNIIYDASIPLQNVVVSPEYYGGTQHCNNFDFNFTILGGVTGAASPALDAVQNLLQNVYDARHTFHHVSAYTAIITKYMENSWLATKVSFCNAFADIAAKYDVDYNKVRELFILDPRVNPSHTFVYADHPYYDTHCLNKDVPAIANEADSEFLKFIIDWNEKRKEPYMKRDLTPGQPNCVCDNTGTISISTEDLLQLAKDKGIELTDEQLAAVTGGGCGKDKDDDDKNDGRRKYEP